MDNQNIVFVSIFHIELIRKDMDVNEHERLSKITLRHKLKLKNSTFIAVLHFIVTVGSSTMSIIHTLK